jgi:hypothetical protein
MNVHGYIYREGGVLKGEIARWPTARCPRHHGSLVRVASASSWAPHFACTWCSEIYVLIGGDLLRCETPDICVVRPLRLVARRNETRPRVQAGPMSRGLL